MKTANISLQVLYEEIIKITLLLGFFLTLGGCVNVTRTLLNLPDAINVVIVGDPIIISVETAILKYKKETDDEHVGMKPDDPSYSYDIRNYKIDMKNEIRWESNREEEVPTKLNTSVQDGYELYLRILPKENGKLMISIYKDKELQKEVKIEAKYNLPILIKYSN